MTDHRFTNIPPTEFYAGMLKARIPGTERAIQIFGFGEEAEALLSKAIEERTKR